MDEQEIALRHSRILSQRGLYALECFGERKEEKKKKRMGREEWVGIKPQ